ncbi:MAG: hypothetical protein ACI9AU_001852 [Bacteroidia bacterium]|jgi:hypothetical protein
MNKTILTIETAARLLTANHLLKSRIVNLRANILGASNKENLRSLFSFELNERN